MLKTEGNIENQEIILSEKVFLHKVREEENTLAKEFLVATYAKLTWNVHSLEKEFPFICNEAWITLARDYFWNLIEHKVFFQQTRSILIVLTDEDMSICLNSLQT